MPDTLHRPTWAEVDLGCIRSNVAALRAQLQPSSTLMAIVKADAYGHGAVAVARATLEAGATHLGVAMVEEGVALRSAGVTAPILVLGWTPIAEARMVMEADLDQCIFDPSDATAFAAAGRALGRRVRLHAKVDTGMGRIGLVARKEDDLDAVTAAIAAMARTDGVELAGIFTHFASADADDLTTAHAQLTMFQEVLAGLQAMGIRPRWRHCANSAAILRLPESHLDLCRAGIALYGYPASSAVPRAGLQPALRWYTEVAQVKSLRAGESVSYNATYTASRSEWVATLPVGYADGFPRRLSNVGRVLIGGVPHSVRGRVCMDQIVVSLDDGPLPQRGDHVVLIGEEQGSAQWADDLAQQAGTIAYEVLCGISRRVPRLYRG